jgi:hypothetical protein
MLLENLNCASWRDPKHPRQVEVYDCGWTNDDLADAMDQWHWAGDVESLVQGLGRRTDRRLAATIERGTVGGDDIYVVRPVRPSIGARAWARHREGLARPPHVWHAVIDDGARALCGVDVAVPYETTYADPSQGGVICAICGDAALGWRRGVGAASDGGELPPVR